MLLARSALAQSVSSTTDPTPPAASQRATRVLAGTVRDEVAAPVLNARVSLVGTALVTYTNSAGRFRFSAVPVGVYALRIARLGHAQQVEENVRVAESDSTMIDVQLRTSAIPLSQLTITPGSFTLLDAGSSSRFSLSREALLTAPQLAEDVFRSLNRLPGLSGSDFSAKIRIRNGGVDEQLVTLDGLELIEPFHLKDFDGALSILDGESIGRVSVTTGGFTAASGNRLTGLLDLQSATPSSERSHTAVGLSVSNMRVRTEGSFGGGRGSWLASARRGYLDLLFKLLRETDPPDPRYSDLFGKVQYALTSAHTLSFEGLLATDRMKFIDGGSSITSSYDNRYVWSTLTSQLGRRVRATTLLSLSSLTWRRDGVDQDQILGNRYDRVKLVDRRSLRALSFKQDWSADLSPSMSLLFGGELRGESADYAYTREQRERAVISRTIFVIDSTIIHAALTPSGSRTSAYLSLRARPATSITAEVGGRVDRHAWTGQTTVAPRTNVAWMVASGTTVRAAWGLYYQAHTLQDLSVVDGDTAFARAERAEHRVLGIEQELGRGWSARAEAYQRIIASPRARYFNVDGSLDALPEGASDRVRFAPNSAKVHGLELLAQYDAGGHVRAGASLVLSRATAMTADRESPRPFDEPVAATMDFAYRGTRGWTFAAAWTAHSGWPTSAPSFKIDTVSPGRFTALRLPSSPYYGERLAMYQRVDLRATRTVQTTHGRLNVWADIFNLLDHRNQRGYEYSFALTTPTNVRVTPRRQDFLGILPSLGIGWEF